jgi:hypothetical protein
MDDKRTEYQRKKECTDCETLDWRGLTPTMIEALRTQSEAQQRTYAIGALKRIEAGKENDPVAFARTALKHILGPDWKNDVGL